MEAFSKSLKCSHFETRPVVTDFSSFFKNDVSSANFEVAAKEFEFYNTQ